MGDKDEQQVWGGNESCFEYTNFEILIKRSTRDDKRQVFFSMSLEFGGRL